MFSFFQSREKMKKNWWQAKNRVICLMALFYRIIGAKVYGGTHIHTATQNVIFKFLLGQWVLEDPMWRCAVAKFSDSRILLAPTTYLPLSKINKSLALWYSTLCKITTKCLASITLSSITKFCVVCTCFKLVFSRSRCCIFLVVFLEVNENLYSPLTCSVALMSP